MAIKRIVSTEFWTDKKVVEQFTPEDKLFFLYLLTNPHTTQLGIYPFIPKIAAFEIGYSKDTVLSLIERFEKYGIVKFSETSSEIAVKNYLKHSIVKGGTPVYDLLVKEANLVKDKSLLRFVLCANRDSLNDTVRKFISDIENENEYDNDNDNDNEDSYHESYHESSAKNNEDNDLTGRTTDECLIYLNAVTGKNFKITTESNRKFIRARLNDGYTFDDFKRVIDNQWLKWKDTDMVEYMRPETLFNATKFQSYINAPDYSKQAFPKFQNKAGRFEQIDFENIEV